MKIQPRDLVWCGLFGILIAIGGFLRIPLPIVPFTFQTFFVMLAGLLLGAKRAAAACLLYLLLGLLGLPIFTQGGGAAYVLKPTFGYLIGFIFGAGCIGKIAYPLNERVTKKRLIFACAVGLAVIYLFGTIYYFLLSRLYLNNMIGIWSLLTVCVASTLPGDVILVPMAVWFAKRIYKTKILR